MPSMYNSPDITSSQAQTQQGADHRQTLILEAEQGQGGMAHALRGPLGTLLSASSKLR